MTRQIKVGNVPIGGGAPVAIQSMLNTKTAGVKACLEQICKLHDAGCQIVRLAVPDKEAVQGFGEICKASPLPLVADIHFDYKLAIGAAEAGASKIRINPGNIGGEDRVEAVVKVCKERNIPIRIGVMAAAWIRGCWKSMAIPPLRHWWRALLSILLYWRNLDFMIPVYL